MARQLPRRAMFTLDGFDKMPYNLVVEVWPSHRSMVRRIKQWEQEWGTPACSHRTTAAVFQGLWLAGSPWLGYIRLSVKYLEHCFILHEVTHAVLHLAGRVGINPADCSHEEEEWFVSTLEETFESVLVWVEGGAEEP